MTTVTVLLPESLEAFVDEQVARRGHGTRSEYVQELIQREQDRIGLCGLLLTGAESVPQAQADAGYFDELRGRMREPDRV